MDVGPGLVKICRWCETVLSIYYNFPQIQRQYQQPQQVRQYQPQYQPQQVSVKRKCITQEVQCFALANA